MVCLCHASKDVVWFHNVLLELELTLPKSAVIYEDNQVCVTMIKNHSVSGHNRHFCVKMVWFHEQVTSGVVQFRFVPSKFNVTDVFTKILAAVPFKEVHDLLFTARSTGSLTKLNRSRCCLRN